ncbi:hypothetical protein Pint_16699 [Pistacia integerrima]|uniref:Uncharacterized protein n=1 Tax=Pistacia integerrima TaxID=434235 RepID=A0ACC0ZGA3_9ROSI|nr:hypothetical protein Pint_16699 [Pistacia integerrima]
MYGDGNSETIVPGSKSNSQGFKTWKTIAFSKFLNLIDGYKTSLYAHAYQQFYHNCIISGIVGLIFGDATVIIQSSTLIIEKSNNSVEKYAVTAPVRSIRQ